MAWQRWSFKNNKNKNHEYLTSRIIILILSDYHKYLMPRFVEDMSNITVEVGQVWFFLLLNAMLCQHYLWYQYITGCYLCLRCQRNSCELLIQMKMLGETRMYWGVATFCHTYDNCYFELLCLFSLCCITFFSWSIAAFKHCQRALRCAAWIGYLKNSWQCKKYRKYSRFCLR